MDTRKTTKLSPQVHRELKIFTTTRGHKSADEAIKYLLDQEATR